MKLKLTAQLWLMLACVFGSVTMSAQQTPLDIAQQHVRTNYADWNLTEQDVADMTVSDMYTDKTTGITRVYFLQRHQGIPVFNAIMNLNITKEGRVYYVGKRFVQNLASKVNTTVPVLTPEAAIGKAIAHLGLTPEPLVLEQKVNDQEFIFKKGNLSSENMSAKLRYQNFQGKTFLSWDVFIAPKGTSDMWNLRVDAVVGSILDKNNWTVYCHVDTDALRHTDGGSNNIAQHNHEAMTFDFSTVAGNGTYNVWPYPIESPKHGPRTMVDDPAHPAASPFGWHDTNGVDGAEFTITRGNNVHAYDDRDGDNTPLGNEPDGGADLIFDFPYDAATEPQQYIDAATVNLFYWNNFMHDYAYNYGMTEAEGAFQDNNYGNGGAGNDHVLAEAQDGADTGNLNNANFATPADGGSGRMQMFVWTTTQDRFLTVNAPASIAGEYDTSIAGAGWGTGAYVSATPVSGEVVIVDDNVEDPYSSDACEEIINAPDLMGKIALIDRGGCEFGFKAVQAMNAGAIGVIICNFEDAYITMAPGLVGNNDTIPVVFINVVDCQTIRQFVGNGLTVTLVNPGQNGPNALDGDLDNGIIAHEYGHGISNRLTGGPSQAGCLNNAEQMGEGWSDVMSLFTTVKAGDNGVTGRGVGTFAIRQETNGRGIRRYPYSTDMNINPLTYGDVAANTEVHALGEVWTAMCWDLYWALVDKYGFDEDIFNGTGGNNIATRLVFEGMKNQVCNPGFLDGRDAILFADEILYNSENECLIWEVFARRGAGYSAVQGDANNAADQTEAFDLLPICLNKMVIEKTVTDFINAGDEIEVSIYVGNFKAETVTNVVVNDVLANGTTYVAGSSSVPSTVSGNTISFELGSMAFTDEKTITYKVASDPGLFSKRLFLDDVPDENADQNWEYSVVPDNAAGVWFISDIQANSPDWAWLAEDFDTESRQALDLITPLSISGDRPTLRFYHLYDTEAGADGGVVYVREVGTTTWKPVADNMLRNGYPGFIQYGTFVVPNLMAFSGTTNGAFIPTYVDLSEYAGKDINVRFRFGTDDNTAGPLGWIVDDVEYMDLFFYNTEACVTSAQGDNECAIAPQSGTIVESAVPSGTHQPLTDVKVSMFPNPASDVLHIGLSSDNQQEITVSIMTTDGKEVMVRTTEVFGNATVSLNVANVPTGFYFVKVSTAQGVLVEKVIID